MPNNRPTICTADEQNCVAITSRMHCDVGGYDYRPNTAATSPQKLDNGENVRRARIGVIGKFLSDWNFALIYDFGGTSDGFGGTASVGGVPVGFLPGGGTSGIENAYLSYTGLKPFGGKMAVEGGIMDIPYTLDETTSSNDILFMERSSAESLRQYRRRRLPLHLRHTVVERRVLGRRLCNGADHGRDPFGLQHQSARHDRTVWRHCPRSRPDHQRQRTTPCISAPMPSG